MIDTIIGDIKDYDPESAVLKIEAKYSDIYHLVKRDYKKCKIQLIDNRKISSKQRNACYALIRAISDFSGMGIEDVKTWTKIRFVTENLSETADNIFSLSTADMTLVREFLAFLIDFVLSWDIPTDFPLLDMVDDYKGYVYACVLNRKCMICGRGNADIHHVVPIGMGADRKTMVHEGLEVMPLCRVHHNEIHQYGKDKWNEMYHTDGGVTLDKALCKALGLKAGKDEID